MSENEKEFQPPETEMLDVIVTLAVSSPREVPPAVAELRAAGLTTTRVDDLNGVVEGTIDAQNFAALRRARCARHVRPRFEYLSHPATGNAAKRG